MNKTKKFLFLTVLFSISCGKDQISKKETSTSNLLKKECQISSEHIPSCGIDGKNYNSPSEANCYSKLAHIGHCNCDDSFIVCGTDDKNYNECELINNEEVKIKQYSACGLKSI